MIYMRNRDFKTQKKENRQSSNIINTLIKKLQTKKVNLSQQQQKRHQRQKVQLKIQKQNQKQKQKSNFRISRTNQQNNQSMQISRSTIQNQQGEKKLNFKDDAPSNITSSNAASPFSKIKQSAFEELIGNKNKNCNHCHHVFDGQNWNKHSQENKVVNQSSIKQNNLSLRQSRQSPGRQTYDINTKQTNHSTHPLLNQQSQRINFSPIQILDRQSNTKSMKKQNQNQNQIQPCFNIKIQSQKQNSHQELSATDKYFRFYQKGRNHLIINSMELMLVRNQINNQVYRILPQDVAKIKLLQRIESINKCLAKNQKIVQLYANLIQTSIKDNSKKGQIYSQKYESIQQLQGICQYQENLIQKLRKQLQEKTAISDQPLSQISKKKQKIYSFIDQISLLRHEINRLYNQNNQLNKLLNKLSNQPQNSQLKSHNQSNIDYWNRDQPLEDLERDSIKYDFEQYHLNYQTLQTNQHNITFSDEKGSKLLQQQEKFKEKQNNSIFKMDTKFNQSFTSKQVQQSYSSIIIKQFKNSLKCQQIKYNNKNQNSQQVCHSPRKSKKQQTYSIKECEMKSTNQKQLYNHQIKIQQLEQDIYKFNIQKQYIQNELQKSLRQVQSLQRENQLLRREMLQLKSSNQNTSSFYESKISLYEDKIIKLEREKMLLAQKVQKYKQNSPNKQKGSAIKSQIYQSKLNLQELFRFLKPYHQYSPILLNAVQAYEKKIAFLHEETTKQKITRTKLLSFLNQVMSIFESTQKYFNKLIKTPIFEACMNPNILQTEISSKINDYELLINEIDQENIANNKLQYYLMLIKSITIGISQKDIQTIQEQLFDYIKNLQSRLPTVNEMDDQESMNKSIRSQLE